MNEWFRPVGPGLFQCLICPHGCRLIEGAQGRCKARVATSSGIHNPVASHLSAIRFDPVEKKPLYHFFPGRPILSIGSTGCNLQCRWCQNHAISQHVGHKQATAGATRPEELVAIAASDPLNIGLAFTYNEPVIALEYVVETAACIREARMKTAVITNGFINSGPLQALTKVTDAFNLDLKGFTEEVYSSFAGGHLSPVLKAAEQIRASERHLEITFLAVTDVNPDLDDFKNMCRWIGGTLGTDIPLHISRYRPDWEWHSESTPLTVMQQLCNIASEYLSFVYLGNVNETGGQTTFCPSCGLKLIERSGFKSLVTGITGNHCTKCGQVIYGSFG